MSWKSLINSNTAVWTGVEGYCDERIDALTLVCRDPNATDREIRSAQAGIEELQRLKAMPDTLRATATLSKTKPRAEY